LKDDVKIIHSSIDITNSTIEGDLNAGSSFFTDFNFIFRGDINFGGSTFISSVWFNGAIFTRNVNFIGSTFGKHASFRGAVFGRLGGGILDSVNFQGTTFDYAYFDDATFSRMLIFRNAKFNTSASFNRTTFNEWVIFLDVIFKYASFSGSNFNGSVNFEGVKSESGLLTFRNAIFAHAGNQEAACRLAKIFLSTTGNRDEEEYHFYREMEAKRIWKGIRKNKFAEIQPALINSVKTRNVRGIKNFLAYDVLEFSFVQTIFGYGVHPFWLFGWWLVFVVVFAAIYLIKGGIEQPEAKQWYDYFWFSVATAATPGYALYKPLGMFKFLAGIEAILGTFMWAAFITTFARKFMR